MLSYLIVLLVSFVGTSFIDMTVVSTEGDIGRQIAILISFVLMLLALVEKIAKPWRNTVPITILLLLAYCLLSVSWAIDPAISIRRLALTALGMWIVFTAVDELGFATILRITRWMLAALLIVNYATVYLSDLGVHGVALGDFDDITGHWRGILPHKNVAGVICAITVLLFVFDARRIPVVVRGAVILASLFFLYEAHSKTSWGTLLAALLAGGMMRFYSRRGRRWLIPALVVGVLVVSALAAHFASAGSDIINDPASISGRVWIWTSLLEYAGDHPWTGAGFGSFWQIGLDSPINEYGAEWMSIYAGHGHNGYLDLLVTIGLPGLILALVSLVFLPAYLLVVTDMPASRRALLTAMLIFAVSHNFTESSLLDRVSALQVFLMLALAAIHNTARQANPRRSPAWRKLLRKPARRVIRPA